MKALAEQIVDIDGVEIYGRVVGVRGLMVEIAGPTHAMPVGARLTIETANRPIPCEVVGFHEGHALAMPFAALEGVRRGGRVVMLGNPSGDVTLPAKLISQIMRRELALLGTWNSSYSASGLPDDWRTVLAAVAAGTIKLKPLISHRFPLDQTLAGMTVMKSRNEFVAKVLINS